MAFTDVLKEWFPLTRGRTGVEVLTRKVPVVFRLYDGVRRALVWRCKVRSSVIGNRVLIGTKPVAIPYRAIAPKVTDITIAFDYPILDRVETALPGFPVVQLEESGTITLTPTDGRLLELSGSMEDDYD